MGTAYKDTDVCQSALGVLGVDRDLTFSLRVSERTTTTRKAYYVPTSTLQPALEYSWYRECLLCRILPPLAWRRWRRTLSSTSAIPVWSQPRYLVEQA